MQKRKIYRKIAVLWRMQETRKALQPVPGSGRGCGEQTWEKRRMRRKISRFFAGILAAALVISSGSGAVSARGTDRAVMWSAREAEDPEKDILEDNGDAGSSGPESNAPAGSRTGDDVQGSVGSGNDASDGSGAGDDGQGSDGSGSDASDGSGADGQGSGGSGSDASDGSEAGDNGQGSDGAGDDTLDGNSAPEAPQADPVGDGTPSERAGGQDQMEGAVEVLLTAGIPAGEPQVFQVELSGAASGSEEAVLEPATEDALDPPQASVRFPGLAPGSYEVRVSGSGYVTYTQKIQVDGLEYRVQLYAGDAGVKTAGSAHPGLLAKGDLNGDGKLDSGDTDLLVNAIDAGEYRPEYDLYGDSRVDLLDLNYLTRIMGQSREATLERFIPLDAAEITVAVGGIHEGSVDQLSGKEGGLTLSDAGSGMELDFDFSRYREAPVMEEILIGAPENKERAIAEGIVVIEKADGGSVVASVTERAAMSFVAAQESFTITPERDGSIRISLGGQIAVKRVTFKITKTANAGNLAEISSVKFVNDMESRIPEPEMDIPKNMAVRTSSRAFTVSWDRQNNVTAYEVRIVSEGRTDYRRTTATELNIQQFLGDKLTNGMVYEVSVQSLNGEWKSGFCASAEAVPKPNGRPDAPDGVKVTGGYRSLDVRWKKMEDTDSYTLYYREDGAASWEKIEGISGTYCQVTGLKDNTRYQVYLTGVNEIGEGPASLTASDKTISGLIPAKLPEYRLINTSNGEGKLSAHIVSAAISGASMVDSPLDQKEGSALGAFDNSYTSYIDRQDWDYGGAYPGRGKGVTVELDAVYEIGMITLAQPMDLGEFAYANIQYEDESGKWQTAKNVTISVKRSGDRKYYLIKLKDPVRTSRLQIGVGHRYGYYKVAISEIRLHTYDSLERDILDLYADDLYITLKDSVNQAVIDALQERLDTKDPVCGEYHPERDALQKELDAAKALLATEGLGQVIQVNPDITAQKDSGLSLGGLMGRQPLGVTAAAEENIVVYVGNPGMKSGDAAKLQLVFTQHYAESGGLLDKVSLKIGRNEITVPKLSSTDVEKGGALYVQYIGNNPEDQYAVRISGGTSFPVLNLYRVPEGERAEKISSYTAALRAYVEKLSAMHMEEHQSGGHAQVEGYAYSENTCILNTTDIVTDYMMLSVPASQVLAGLGADADSSMDGTLKAMDRMLLLFYQHKGLTDSFAEGTAPEIVAKNHLPYQCLNIRYMRMFAGAFMYAAGDHVGIGWGSVPGLMNSVPVQADAEGRYVSGRYFGWGIAHEIGHQINQSAYAHAEVTNNYFSVLAQAKDTNDSVRFQYPEVFKKVTSNTTGYAGNVFTQLGMYWQLHLAYDRGYNYKTYGTWQEIQENLFFARVDRYARDTASAPAPGGTRLELSGGRDQNLMRLASAAAERDLTEFFTRWGMVPDDGTRAYMGQFAKEERAIYYVDDAARVYEKTHSKPEGVTVSSVTAKDNGTGDVTITISSSAPEGSIQGYEVTRTFIEGGKPRTEVAGFTQGSTFTDHAAFAANHTITYKVRAVDKWMNYSAEKAAAPVKVSGSGILDKSGWTVTTNMESRGDVLPPDGTDELPCEPVKESSITKVINNDQTDLYTGTASDADPYILLQLNRQEEISSVSYVCDAAGTPMSDYKIEVSRDGETYKEVAGGTWTFADGMARVHFTDTNHRICTYDAAFVKLTASGQKGEEISVTELSLFGPSGDSVKLEAQGIGELKTDYVYDSGNPGEKIPAGSIVFTGTYKGNPAYNVVVLYDADGNIVGGTNSEGELTAHQIILAPPLGDEDAVLGNVSEGIWIYWFEPEDNMKNKLPEQVRAELYRVDNALTNEGQRLVSDTPLVEVPGTLPGITIEKTPAEESE